MSFKLLPILCLVAITLNFELVTSTVLRGKRSESFEVSAPSSEEKNLFSSIQDVEDYQEQDEGEQSVEVTTKVRILNEQI